MRISIIVPVLNEASGIARALQPFQCLRSAGHEVILVDGGSQDQTPELAADFVDMLERSDPGRAVQMHAGAARATGDILWFVHADTQVAMPAFEELLNAAQTQQSPMFWGRFDIAISGSHVFLPVVAWLMNKRSRLTGIATGDQGLFVSQALYLDSGGFQHMALMEDIEYCTRLRDICAPLCLEGPLITSGRRWEQKGLMRTIFLMWFLRLAYFLGVSPQRLSGWYYPEQK